MKRDISLKTAINHIKNRCFHKKLTKSSQLILQIWVIIDNIRLSSKEIKMVTATDSFNLAPKGVFFLYKYIYNVYNKSNMVYNINNLKEISRYK